MTSTTEHQQQLSQYEYLDHTADIMFVWGSTLNQSYEQMALAMMNYMVELDSVHLDQHSEDEIKEHTFNVEGHDMDSLLFAYLDEILFIFSTEFIVFKEISIVSFDRESFKIEAKGRGVELDKEKHTTGTEIKAITYSCMKIEEKPERTDVFVIVDI
ncbi:hypothetical protein SAMD00019534_059640, partial [Acytostelium subglobosum LB1]|uniref:hypothetical protein n=1 Tax=Acytostelium subglobosum LB1 TaxID=1410327 RepID=UPI000644C377